MTTPYCESSQKREGGRGRKIHTWSKCGKLWTIGKFSWTVYKLPSTSHFAVIKVLKFQNKKLGKYKNNKIKLFLKKEDKGIQGLSPKPTSNEKNTNSASGLKLAKSKGKSVSNWCLLYASSAHLHLPSDGLSFPSHSLGRINQTLLSPGSHSNTWIPWCSLRGLSLPGQPSPGSCPISHWYSLTQGPHPKAILCSAVSLPVPYHSAPTTKTAIPDAVMMPGFLLTELKNKLHKHSR